MNNYNKKIKSKSLEYYHGGYYILLKTETLDNAILAFWLA